MVGRRCSRPLCEGHAQTQLQITYTDRVAELLWTPQERDPNVLELCLKHANRFTPPLGWSFTDRRCEVTPLFDVEGPSRLSVLGRAALVYVGAILVAAIVDAVLGGGSVEQRSAVHLFVVSAVNGVLLGAGAIWLARSSGAPQVARTLRFRTCWRDVRRGLVYGVATQIALVVLYVPILWLVDGDVSEDAQDLADRFPGAQAVLLVVLVVVIAPAAEELFFRGIVQGALGARWAPIPSVIVTSLIFAIVHLQLLQLPGLVVVGLVTGFVAHRTDRIAPSIWVHAAFNGTTLLSLSVFV